MENFSDLTQQEPLALAITLEEEDSRTHNDLAKAMREIYPGTARIFAAMAEKKKHIGQSQWQASAANGTLSTEWRICPRRQPPSKFMPLLLPMGVTENSLLRVSPQTTLPCRFE